tara:strand:- start:1195 stop:1371 length:177 start_codon:yes stop_codon:yes gene_type:complete
MHHALRKGGLMTATFTAKQGNMIQMLNTNTRIKAVLLSASSIRFELVMVFGLHKTGED